MHTLLLPQDRLHPHDFVKTGVVHIHDYQLYAVEKWIVDRHRQVTLLVVYTGDPTHNITLSSYTPSSSLTPDDAQAAWDRAISLLRADGAKPKQVWSHSISPWMRTHSGRLNMVSLWSPLWLTFAQTIPSFKFQAEISSLSRTSYTQILIYCVWAAVAGRH